MICFKQCCHLPSSNYVMYAVVALRMRNIPGNNLEYANLKKRDLELLLGIFFWFALRGLVASVFSPSRCSYLKILQHLSRSVHGRSCAQVWYQGNCSLSAYQSRWSYPTWASLAHSRRLTVVNARTTSLHTLCHTYCIAHNIIWGLHCHDVFCTLFVSAKWGHWQCVYALSVAFLHSLHTDTSAVLLLIAYLIESVLKVCTCAA